MKITGLRVDHPDFFLENDDAVWLSRLKFRDNVGQNIALISKNGPESGRVHGIAELRTPHRIQSVRDVFDQVPDEHFFQFQDTDQDVWAYPVRTVMNFEDPKEVKDGLFSGQRNFLSEVEFSRQTVDNLKELPDAKIQQFHDRIHAAHEKRDVDEHDFNVHFLLAREYRRRDMTHPDVDELDQALHEFQESERPCRIEGETKEECVSRKIPIIAEEHPEWERSRVVAVAHSECSTSCDEMSMDALVDNMGAWTAQDAMQWVGGLSREAYERMAQIANDKFVELMEAGRSTKYAFQLSVSKAINQVADFEEGEDEQ